MSKNFIWSDKLINVIGLGYIGLPTALMLASKNYKVTGTDIDVKKIDKLNNGDLTFNESGLEELFSSAKNRGITFSNKYVKTNIYIIAVPTPFIEETKKIDPIYLIKAFQSVLEICLEESIIIIESTISPGFIENYLTPIIKNNEEYLQKRVNLVHAPERIMPGNMLYELINNSRTIGMDNDNIKTIVLDLYKSFCQGEIIVTDIKTAEMSKVVENTFRDINIAFANELAVICRKANINVYDVIKIANKHPRVNILNPGPGVGGHCIPVDPWFLVGEYPEQSKLVKSAREVNEGMIDYVYSRIIEVMEKDKIMSFERVGLYGISYKENIDDFRESPTIKLIKKYNQDFQLFDPHVNNMAIKNKHEIFYNIIM